MTQAIEQGKEVSQEVLDELSQPVKDNIKLLADKVKDGLDQGYSLSAYSDEYRKAYSEVYNE